jgi:hypothetical protein
MLGVRRTSVTSVASELPSAGVISYSRGVIAIIKRKDLERLSCECYETLVQQSSNCWRKAARTIAIGGVFESMLPDGAFWQ